MGERTILLPDVGEGIAEAEVVEWHVKVGDLVREDATLAAVMTDKATVEIPSPADGKVTWLAAEIGERVAVGAPLVRLEVEGDGEPAVSDTAEHDAGTETDARVTDATPRLAEPASPPRAEAEPRPAPPPAASGRPPPQAGGAVPRPEGERPLASPAVRLRARESGIDLRQVPGSGPVGRITHEDLDAFFRQGPSRGPTGLRRRTAVEEIKVVGLRRRIAERMALATSRIPHITYVEEVDVTALEELRARLNAATGAGSSRLTILPFLMRAMVRAIARVPKVNALFDDQAGIVRQHAGVHVGIATQTDAGLVVPVVRHAEARDLRDCAAELARVSGAARAGTATRDELTGSTITITSLGALGGIATTPIINHPEVAIVGVNRIAVRPHWDGSAFVPRRVMNLSSSFDHRVIDGWDAALFVQRIKELLEAPAMIFIEDEGA